MLDVERINGGFLAMFEMAVLKFRPTPDVASDGAGGEGETGRMTFMASRKYGARR